MRFACFLILLAAASCAPMPALAERAPVRQTAGWSNPRLIIEGHVRPGPLGRQTT
jgi:hypothetical protein